MKRRNYLLSLLFFLSCFLTSFTLVAQSSYNILWRQVDKFEKDKLPKSALNVVNQILKKSTAEKNYQQTVKGLIYRGKFKRAIDESLNPELIRNFEDLLKSTVSAPDKALLHSLLAELYQEYEANNRNDVMVDRTDVHGFIPEKMDEWSRNIYIDKIRSHLQASVADEKNLLSRKTNNYDVLVTLGEDSRTHFPTLYDFLMRRSIDILSSMDNNEDLSVELKKQGVSIPDLARPVASFVKLDLGNVGESLKILVLKQYQSLLASLLRRGQWNSLIWTELDRIHFISDNSSAYAKNYELNALLELTRLYPKQEALVDVIRNISGVYSERGDKYDSERYAILQKGITEFADSKQINILKNSLLEMETPHAQLTGKMVYFPGEKKTVRLTYKNLSQASVSIYKLGANGQMVKMKEYPVSLTRNTTYSSEIKEISLDIAELGNYCAVLTFDKKYENGETKYNFSVSNLISAYRRVADNEYAVYVTDRTGGKPFAGASVVLSLNKNNQKTIVQTAVTNADGIARVILPVKAGDSYPGNFYYTLQAGEDKPSVVTYVNSYYGYYRMQPDSESADKKQEYLSLLTDRSVYRPGQTVCFKLIASEGYNGDNRLLADKVYDVALQDVNGREVAKKTLKTNEFGSLAGEFVLPQGLLNGYFTIRVNESMVGFRVEEYKRPTFQVMFDKVDKTYTFDEAVTLKGRAENFSGVKLQGLNVNYVVTRQRINLWRWWGGSSRKGEVSVEEGTTQTHADGSFSVTFTPRKEDADEEDSFYRGVYLFTVNARITDLNGETQSQSYSLRVSDVSMFLNTNISDKYDKDAQKEIEIKATNLDGNEIPATGSYEVFTTDENDSLQASVLKGTFVAGLQKELPLLLIKLPSCKYAIVLKAKDSQGNEVTDKTHFTLYSLADKRPPFRTNDWFIEKNTKIAPGKPVEVILGVSDKDVYLLYELTKGNAVLEQKIFKLNEENRLFRLDYKKEYEQDAAMSFTLIRDGQLIQHQTRIVKEDEIKALNVKFAVFRDKLLPGQKEEWRITVKDDKGQPAVAELLASMYDSSLDKISPMNPWSLNLSAKRAGNYSDSFNPDRSFQLNSLYYPFNWKYVPVTGYKFDNFNWFGYFYKTAILRSNMLLNESIAVRDAGAPKYKMQADQMIDRNKMEENAVSRLAATKTIEFTPPEIMQTTAAAAVRSNFNETAFFYPQLRTNEKGETVISFTVPESNTTWKFRALAYDKNLSTGQLEASVVTRKELMVTPNLPRFVRTGDRTSVSTKISNLSEKVITGKVRIEFFNPVTNRVVDLGINNQAQDFSLEKDASSSASWTFAVPADYDMLACRILAESETFSDGEQHLIPVLPHKMLVTESLPMYIRGGQTRQFAFEHLLNTTSPTLVNQRLTLEFSSNPTWYAVQALPTLSNPSDDNAVSWFAGYFVNTLGSFIPKKYPEISAMIETWKKQGGTTETLFSALQKNEELKNVLLQETPWVLEAKNEAEQKQRLALLFDMNRAQALTAAAIQKLQALQTESGGWPWYKGFYPSRSITQYILYGFAELVNLNAVEFPNEVRQMQMNALKYVDAQMVEDFKNLKKENKNWQTITSIGITQLEYLYVRSFYRDVPVTAETREAERFYTSVVEKNRTQLSLYEQSLLAVLMKQKGNRELMNKIMASLREHATVSDEMGMYWANNKSSVFFSRSAVAVHTFLMEAFRVCGSSAEEMDNLKLWLLKQKQTQQWESTHGTLASIYALLSNGSDWLPVAGDVSVQLGTQSVDMSGKEAGTGFVKQSWESASIKPEMGRVTVAKKDNGPAYGALYWQYLENLDKIDSHLTKELNVTRMLMKEVVTEKGKALQPITDTEPLQVGDMAVVRLVVRADRDMDFVQLKDMRASCFEPVDQISGVQWNSGILCYRSSKDASTNFYFDFLPKGTYTFEYRVSVARAGEYKNGIASVQCLYAPEFVSHTEGQKLRVGE